MPPNVLQPSRLDRAGHRRKDLEFLERELQGAESLVLPMWRELNLVADGQLALLPLHGAGGLLDAAGELVWLGTLGGTSCFALDLSALPDPLKHPALSGRGEFVDLRTIAAALPRDDATVAAYARGILHWHGRQQHCGACGSRTAPREGGHMRMCRNEACAAQHFPRTDPAIIVLVHDGEECLLGRQKRWPKGMYSTLAGFVEPGETMEEAVAREVEEEAGVLVQDVRYFRSQPWPYPASLMIGFTARAASRTIRLGDQELEDAAWFSRAQLRDAKATGISFPGANFALSGQLIAAFLATEGEPTHEP